MKSTTVKSVSITFLVFSLAGWATFAIFFAPEGFFTTSEPPIAPSSDPVSLLYFFLFLIGIAIPMISLLGLIISTILGIRERREEEANPIGL